jgi:DNA-binding NarL/FixJ family response regulator
VNVLIEPVPCPPVYPHRYRLPSPEKDYHRRVSRQVVDAAFRVAIIEDVRDVRESLRLLIDNAPGFRVAAAYRTMEDALADLDEAPDVILTDIGLPGIGLPGMGGIEGTRLLRNRFPGAPIIALTVYDDDDNVFDAICAGASGYLLKNTPPARLLASLHDVANGGAPMSPEVARRVLALFREFRPPPPAHCHLTPQESALLNLMVEGHHYKTAAAELGISTSTVSFHLKHVYQKLQVHSKTEAVARALRDRLV